ncbi:hypothetical protein [Gemmatimonas phototrophica]|nr:hypothetical protein [Gemmatimonas phototrophica]
MFKFFLALLVGLAIGYGYGWKDAQQHEKNVAERVIERIGGETRERMGNDVDTRYGTGDSK